MASVNLVTLDTGRGHTRSRHLIEEVLTAAGHRFACNDLSRDPPVGARYDVTIFYQDIAGAWLEVAPVNCLIPNQEWFDESELHLLACIDVVLAKTRHAADVFSRMGCHVEYIGFTAEDRRLGDVERDLSRWLHVAGRSPLKGTEVVVETWHANPHFPKLLVVQNTDGTRPQTTAANLSVIDDYVPDHVLRVLQNWCGVHLCPSEAEGWGHYLVEGMSVGAVVVTTDAPPMNELVTAERGVLCAYDSRQSLALGTTYRMSPATLAATVEAVVRRPVGELHELGARARAFYNENDGVFAHRFVQAIGRLLTEGPDRSQP
jgi:glycosyltransferase involved in cell wall biosynthesis